MMGAFTNYMRSFTSPTVGFRNQAYELWYIELTFLAVKLILLIYIFLKPNFIINLAIPSNKPYCPECGYQLTKPIPKHCSECGIALPNILRAAVNDSDSSAADTIAGGR